MKTYVGRMRELMFAALACVGLMATNMGHAASSIEVYGKLPQVELVRHPCRQVVFVVLQ